MTAELVLLIATIVLLLVVAALLGVLLLRRNGAEAAAQRHHLELLDEREDRLNRAETDLARRTDELAARDAELARAEAKRAQALADVAGMSVEQAKAEVVATAEAAVRLEVAQLSRELEATARRDADRVARQLIVTSMQRLAAEQTSDGTVAVVPLPGEEMKGRIIGREGRNIKAFEQVTGVNLLIDETPGTVVLSSFDPHRREVARLTLTELVEDGRIHPARIEDVWERVEGRVEQESVRAAEDALVELGITDLDAGLLPTIGALRFRTSYGQNVLRHSVEAGRIAGLIAAELGLDVATCTRAAFLHDIGKAIPGETSHATAGAALARRYGEHPDIVHAIEAHHNEVEPHTVEAVLVQVADAISGSRPGARAESVELYAKRLQRLEDIAAGHRGVEKAFALQAGREVRVMVAPEQVSDAEATALAREIASQVEAELSYPGSIKVLVVRESRATAMAR
ncbi:MAG: ribonuclease Y [Propionibacteriaceae bacterium]|jgi:ribonuclease Y|nr:ribonuclease Y [Propionibacteriaceae bacterium]